MENPLVSRIRRQILRNQQYIYHLGSTYALLGLNMAAMFFLTPTLLEHLGKEGYGIWLVLFGITNYFNLSAFGFGQTFTLELIKNKERQKVVNKLVNTLLFSLLLFAIATFPIFLLVQYKVLGNQIKISPEMMPIASRSFWIIYVVFFLNFISQLPFNILFAKHRLDLRNGIEVIRVTLNFIVTLVVLKRGGGLVELSVATLLVTLIYISILFIVSARIMVYRIHFSFFSKKLFKKFLRPSFHFFLLGLAIQIIVMSESILVSALQAPALVALYTIAMRIPDVSMRFIFKVADVKIPKITALYSAKNWVQLWLLHNRLFWLTFAIAGSVTGLILVFGPWIIHLWMGQDFPLNYTLLLIFSINMLTQSLLHVPGIFLQSIGKHERASIFAMIGAPISIFFAWWFNKLYGLEGIALAMCGTQLLVGICTAPQLYFFFAEKGKEMNHRMRLVHVK